MSGIDISKIDSLITKCEGLIDSINGDYKSLTLSITKLESVYDGKALDGILSKLCIQIDKFNSILSILDNYLLYLKNVRKSYVLQDMRFSQQIGKL